MFLKNTKTILHNFCDIFKDKCFQILGDKDEKSGKNNPNWKRLEYHDNKSDEQPDNQFDKQHAEQSDEQPDTADMSNLENKKSTA